MGDSIRNSIETGPQINDAQLSPPGIREFIETITIAEFGVLWLTLAPEGSEGYRWQFTAVSGSSFYDAGRGRCH